ncbi:uncharacterized protein LOC115462093 [Microcaecilia unicolor]|uniref:Uncharacterized protein LOC115462093 n=1 Tax=Microcaecilia unicolor TaxID=1415580 RepID=A0A6P7WXN1_9AMPH|nr:uncharacterized protein LOC115462093 [Microcaecilia unicolor]
MKYMYPSVCVVCGIPVSADSTAYGWSDGLQDLTLVCTSVLLSVQYPQYTQQQLEEKLRNGKISQSFETLRRKQIAEKTTPEMYEKDNEHFLSQNQLARAKRSIMPDKPHEYFFKDLAHLQKQLVSGERSQGVSVRRGTKLLQRNSSYLAETRKVQHVEKRVAAREVKLGQDPLLPPILSVWAQNDAKCRSLKNLRSCTFG